MKDREGWFICGLFVFFMTLALMIINYDYLDSLPGFSQMKYGLLIVIGLFVGAWMLAQSLFKPKEKIK